MDNQNTPHPTPRSPWYFRYHIFPDPKKPRTPLMKALHIYVYFLYFMYFLIALALGGFILYSDQSFGSILIALACFGLAYFLFRRMKRERVRDRERRQHQ